jgi:NADP-dependent 3-hydroxy acid dehydrogenase YdfG
MRSLHDHVIVITGAGGSIAGAVAEAFLEAGARPALIDKDELSIAGRAASYSTVAVRCDMRSVEAARAAMAEVHARFGHIDGLVHLVGEVSAKRVQDVDDAAFDEAFDSNVRTLVNAVRAVLPELLQRRSGFIAGIASHEAWRGGAPGAALFAAAKSAVASFLRSLDVELADTAINVAICFPMGVVDTATNRRALGRGGRDGLIDPQVIAQAFVQAARQADGGRLVELPVYPPRRRLGRKG